MNIATRRIVASTLGALAITVVTASAAFADPAGGGGVIGKTGGIGDSSGHPLSLFKLDMYVGSALNPTEASNKIWVPAMDFLWSVYRDNMTRSIWLMDWIMGLTWVSWLLAPLKGIANLTARIMGEVGLMPLMMTILACTAGYWMLKGRFGGGLVELGTGLLIASLATGALANPMEIIAGDDGMITQARDAGIDLATAVQSDGEFTSADQTRYEFHSVVSTTLVDTVIRGPHQLFNFGQVIDGTGCEAAYNEGLTNGKLRETVGACDSSLQDFADSPDASKTAAILEIFPTAFVVGGVIIVLSIIMVMCVMAALVGAIKLIVQLITAVASSGSRRKLFKTVADIATGLIMIAFTFVGIVGWMKIVATVMGEGLEAGVGLRDRFTIMNLLMLVGAILLVMARRRLKKANRKAAAALANLGQSAKQAEKNQPSIMSRGSHLLAQEAQARRMARRLGLSGSKAPKKAPTSLPGYPNPVGKPDPINVGHIQAHPMKTRGGGAGTGAMVNLGSQAVIAGANRRMLEAGPNGSSTIGGPNFLPPMFGATSAESMRGAQLRSRLGLVGKIAVQAGMFAATGGASGAATGAKLAAAAKKASTTINTVRTATAATQTIRNLALRDALQSARTEAIRMEPTKGSRLMDATTGVEYRRSVSDRVDDGVEILSPIHSQEPHHVSSDWASSTADRLRERLGNR